MLSPDIPAMVLFIFNGFLGGLSASLLWAESWSELKSYAGVRGLLFGCIGGYLYYTMYSEWNLPNGFLAFIWGYAFKDIVEGIVEKVKHIFG